MTRYSFILLFMLLQLAETNAQQQPLMHQGLAWTQQALPKPDVGTQWFSYADLQVDLNNFKQFSIPLFPDSSVVNIHPDSSGATAMSNFWFSAGQCIDPKDQEFSFFNNIEPYSKFQSFDIDSLRIHYLYERNIHNVTDTLVLHLFSSPNGGMRLINTKPDSVFATVPYNRTTRESEQAISIKEFRILLSAKDSVYKQGQWGSLTIPVFLNSGQKGADIAVTVTFKPGYTWQSGDTLMHDSLSPLKKLNVFSIRAVSNEAALQHQYYNNGIFMDKLQFYQNQFPDTLLNTHYVPSCFYPVSYIPDIAFLLYNSVGIDEVKSAFGLFPNPVQNGQPVYLKSTSKTKSCISVCDLLGQTVYQKKLIFSASESLELPFLKPGVYIVSLSSETGYTTQKLIVKP